MTYDPDTHHRGSVRLRGHDYTGPGSYFVTICTRERECLLGEVIDGEMRLGEYGQVVAESWLWLSQRYAYVDLHAWQVMPNHLHGILVVRGRDRDCTGASRTTPARNPRVKRKPLGRLIGAFKTVSTKRINQIRDSHGSVFWQRGYHDRIIRNDRELHAIRRYIRNNPASWARDSENPHVIVTAAP